MKKIPVAVSLLLVLTFSCNQDESENAQDARFANYISGFTSGLISKKDNITVRFASSIEIPQSVDAKLISLSPSVDGSIVKYGQSLVFSPKEPLRSGTIYEVSVDLKKLLEVEEGLEQFNFSIQTIPMDYEIQLAGLRTTDIKKPKVMELNGTLTTSDFVSEEEVKKMLDAGGKEVVWKHATATSHAFTVKNITRAQQGYKLKITTAGSSIGVDKKQEESIQIPSVKEFDLTTASVQKAGTPYVSLLFSDPLLPNQDLDGLVNVQGEESPRFVIDGNQIQVYLTKMLSGSRSVTVKQGIKNIFGHPLEAAIMRSLAFDAENPAIRFIGQGSILPSSDGLVLPFEAVNLKKVSVDVIQIFEKNIPQFFQVNQINGGSQLTRTGRKVMSKSIALSDYSSDLANWNRFTLDLASLFNSEKGAIYQVRLSFRPEDSLYPCEEIFQEEGQQTSSEETWSVFDRENFNSYYSYYYYPRGYRWSERDNPCHVSYYHSDRFVSRNLVASDLGLITKIGGDNSLHVYTTNMLTASPVKADIEILDYQLQVLANGTTSADGMATFSPERRPFLVIATANGQKSYLKLDDASSRTLSNFDVSGTRVKNWIKGFIYGERGVWRPGNDIFLSFMLEDKDDRIPADQPVIFELRDPYGNVKDRQVSTSSVKDLYTFPTKTDATDVTGNWRASVKVGNATLVLKLFDQKRCGQVQSLS
ncbi:MAG: MG2 domain-containing protein [Bacteroidota bacterium]